MKRFGKNVHESRFAQRPRRVWLSFHGGPNATLVKVAT